MCCPGNDQGNGAMMAVPHVKTSETYATGYIWLEKLGFCN